LPSASSNWVTGSALARNLGSGYSRMGSKAIGFL
jgi:hypothetical protein